MTQIGNLTNRVTFFEFKQTGREASSKEYIPVKTVYCDDYSPTVKDYTVLGSSADKKAVTLKIRNQYKGFQPEIYHFFELDNGYFKGEKFDIKSVSPDEKNPSYLKVIGEGIGG